MSKKWSLSLLAYLYPWVMLLGVNGVGIWLIDAGEARALLLPLLLLAIGMSFTVERLIPYNRSWNRSLGDTPRDWAHALVNETLNALTIASLPFILSFVQITQAWPLQGTSFLMQVFFSILILDFGITVAHWLSHKSSLLWRFHAVHHSVKRLYGFNGLMKHPIHQAIEMVFGTLPLLWMGLPRDVGLALGFCVVVQLLLQHSNADYRVGIFRKVLALNEAHRFHHQKWAGIGDVNFGLFTCIWDHAFGTFQMKQRTAPFSSDELGIAKQPDFPVSYRDQMIEPFRRMKASG